MYWTTPWAKTKSKLVVGKRQALAVGHEQAGRQTLLREVLAREANGRVGDRSTPVTRAPAAREAHQVDAGAAAHLQHLAARADRRTGTSAQQVVELVEVVLVEVLKEAAATRRDAT